MDIVEAPVSLVEVDEQRFPEPDESELFEHLVHYLSHSGQLPGIAVRLEGGKLVLTGRHKYLRVAERLGYERIRMIVSGASLQEFARLVEQPGVTRLDWSEMDRVERSRPLSDQWHVFYFHGKLCTTSIDRFRADIVDRFFTFGDGARCFAADLTAGRIEFVAATPNEHRNWASQLLAALLKFHSEELTIVSYQGSEFRHSL